MRRMSANTSQSRLDMQENALEHLSNTLKREYPDVLMYEISVE